MLNLPYWLHRILFFKSWMDFDIQIGSSYHYKPRKFRLSIQLMHFSPVDSSFTYCRVHIALGDFWMYPIVCRAGYQPCAGVTLSLFHKKIFDFRKWAQRRLAKREGWTELSGEKI